MEGENLVIVCNATEEQGVEVFWVKNDTKSHFRQSSRELKFININRNSRGEYVCYSAKDGRTDNNAAVMEVDSVDVLCKYGRLSLTQIPRYKNFWFDIIVVCDKRSCHISQRAFLQRRLNVDATS